MPNPTEPRICYVSRYHREKDCLCEECYRTFLDDASSCAIICAVIAAFLFCVGTYFIHFRNCQSVGRWRSKFNFRLLTAVHEFRTCVYLAESMVVNSPPGQTDRKGETGEYLKGPRCGQQFVQDLISLIAWVRGSEHWIWTFYKLLEKIKVGLWGQ